MQTYKQITVSQKKEREVENIYFSLFEAHNTLSKIKIKASLKNKIDLESIKTE